MNKLFEFYIRNLQVIIIVFLLVSCAKKNSEDLDALFLGVKGDLKITTTKAFDIISYNNGTCAASSGGEITGWLADVKDLGIVYGKSKGVKIDITGSFIEKPETKDKIFICNLINLEPNTTYYINTYLKTNIGVLYGNEVSFKTPNIPVVNTTVVNGISKYYAFSGGSIKYVGTDTIIHRGVCWATYQDPDITDNKTDDGSGTGSFVSSIAGLSANNTYYVRAYATISAGTIYGDQKTFISAYLNTISLTTNFVSSITSTAAICGGIIAYDGGIAITARGVCWSTSQNPTTLNGRTLDGIGKGSFTSTITGLSAGTTYYVRAYATNTAGTVYGFQQSFVTSAPSIPTLETSAVTSVTATSAIGGGNISSDGGIAITARGVCWSNSQNPTIVNSKTSDGSGTGIFSSAITGLVTGTTYYVRAYATNSTGTVYGAQQTFITLAFNLPTLTISAVSSVTASSAMCGGNITADGGTAITARGVCWSTSQNPTTLNSKTSDGTGTGSFTSAITGLIAGTTYYVRAYAINNTGTAYSTQQTFVPSSLITPTLTTNAASSITSLSAICGGSISADGGSTVTARGVCWSTSQSPTTLNSKTLDGTGSGTFTSAITGLIAGTTYYVRAYATNSSGTNYGNQVNFTTLSNVVPTNGLVAYFPFTGSSADNSGNSNNATATNCTFTGNICNLGGYDSPSQLTVTNSNSLKFTSELTISMFVNITSNVGMDGYGRKVNEGSQCLFAKSSDTYGFYSNMVLKNDNSANINFRIKGGATNAVVNFPNFGLNTWHLIVFMVSGNNLYIYIDGSLSNQTSITSTDFSEANLSVLTIGRFSSWYPLNGKLDDIRIYNRALTNTEILTIYNAGH